MAHDAARPEPNGVPSGSPMLSSPTPVPVMGLEDGVGLTRGALPPPALASGPSVTSLLAALQRRWLLAVGLGIVLAAAGAAGAWYLLEPKWTAVAQVHIAMVPPWLMQRNIDTVSDRSEFVTYQRTQAAQMHSHSVLNSALVQDEVKNLDIVRQQPDRLAWLADQLKVEFQEGNEFVSIKLDSSDPDGAKAIVKAVRDRYFKEVVETERKARMGRKDEVDKVCQGLRAQLQNHEKDLQGVSKTLGVSESGALTQQQIGLLTSLEEKKRQLTQIQFDLVRANAKLEAHKANEKSFTEPTITDFDVNQALEADPAGKMHLARKEKLELVVARYEQTAVRPTEGGLVRARADLEAVEKALTKRRSEVRAALLEGYRQKMRSEYSTGLQQQQIEAKSLADQAKDLKTEVASLAAQTESFGKSSAELENLKDKIQWDRQQLREKETFLGNLEAELGAKVPARVNSFEEASVLPRDQKKQVMAAIAAPAGLLLLTCFGVAWWECRARRIHTADEISTGLGMRVVGAVPSLAHAAQRVVNTGGEDDLHEQHLLESIDGIRTVLLRDADVQDTRVVMVTSAASGEGKTTLASHLAGSLARAGRRTLLIDCDLRRPAVHQLFELPLQPGFSEVLLGEVHVAEATMSTSVDGLWMIPAGQWDRDVVQALARDGVQKIFNKLRNEYDFIVVDSHPVLAATDSLLIGQQADAVILSLMRDVSQTPKVHAAAQRLATLGIRVFGTVMNGLPEEEIFNKGGYQYAVA
jgi:succinoglycan biosynthesis transport protein ExoP